MGRAYNARQAIGFGEVGMGRGQFVAGCTGMRSRGSRLGMLVAATLLLGGCFTETSGTPRPPPEFGAMSRPLLGCPEIEGVYAWPPVAGEHAGRMATNREPWDRGIPVPVGRGEMQVWVTRDEGLVTVRSRRVNRAPNVRDRLAREWSYAEYASDTYSCESGMLVVAPVDLGVDEDFGGAGIRRGFNLARMEDGALAVGILTISYGRKGSLFSWADHSSGSYDAPDKHYWRWSMLSRTGPGDTEPEPIDSSAGSTARSSNR